MPPKTVKKAAGLEPEGESQKDKSLGLAELAAMAVETHSVAAFAVDLLFIRFEQK